jgi:hypothetical protein
MERKIKGSLGFILKGRNPSLLQREEERDYYSASKKKGQEEGEVCIFYLMVNKYKLLNINTKYFLIIII